MKVSISENGVWAGSGVFNGRVEECAAVLPEEVYDRIDKVCGDMIVTGQNEVTFEMNGSSWTVEAV